MKRNCKRSSGQSRRGKLLAMVVSVTVASVMLSVLPARAADMKASLAKMPVYAESTDKGVLVDLAKAHGQDIG